MPCPFFEPQKLAATASSSGGRLPLIDEYDGLCCANGEPVPAPEPFRFRWCNHGNSKGSCPAFPLTEMRSCLRYEAVAMEGRVLRVLCIEEQAFAPLRWYSIEYSCADGSLQPEPEDSRVRSQVLAFCQSYLARFAKQKTKAR